MKRTFLLLVCALSLSFWGWGQTYLTESFEDAWSGDLPAPSGWTQTHPAGGDSETWEKSVWTTEWEPAGNGTKPTGTPYGNAVAHFNDYNSNGGNVLRLSSGDINLSASTNPRVSFYYFYKEGGAVLRVLASNDGGVTWTDLSGSITAPGAAWTKFSFNLASYKVANARIAFEAISAYSSNDLWLDYVVVDEAPAALTGTKTIQSSGGDYATFTAAINDLNGAGVGAGGVTFNVDAGLVATEDCPMLTATGTAANPITFQKSGAGDNPVIKPTGINGSTDAGIKIVGGDYITFDGIDIAINSGSDVEYGYCIYNASATNGAQHNTIKNTKITLNRSNINSAGILQFNVITPSDQGTGNNNNNNKYYNVTIENVYTGIYLRAHNSTYFDTGCEIGITGGGTTTIGSASANDIGNGATPVYGIRAMYQSGIKIFNTTIRNLTCTSLYDRVFGIFLDYTFGTSAIYNNVIGPVTASNTSSSTRNYLASGMTLNVISGATVNVYNNFIFGITTGQTSATGSAPSDVIQAAGIVMGFTGGTSNLYYNSIRIEGSANINSACVLSTGESANFMKLKDNVLSSFTANQSGTPKHYCVMRQGSQGTISTTNYNDFYIANTTNGYVGYYSGDRATLADWQAALSMDAQSKSVNPSFFSSTDLHSTSVDLNEAGVTISTANGDALDITTDIDGDSRASKATPDIGADEFDVNDQTSKAEAPATQVTGTTVASTVTTVGAAVEVFRFKITDAGAPGDGLATKVTNVRITNANPANGASWTANIAGLKLNDGSVDITIGTPTIAASYIDIPITSGNLEVPNGSSKTITLSVYLKTSGIEDGKKLQFTIPATSHGFMANGSGSLFAADFGAAVTGNEHTITVTATKLLFSGVPSTVLLNSNFSSTVTATDANGNTDIDNTASVTLARNSGTGILSSATGLTQSLVGGTKSWTDLRYNTTETFRMQADGGSLTQAVTGDINCVNEIIIGTSTANSQNYPFDVYYGYSRNAALYTRAEIGAYLTLNKLAWQVETAQTTNCPVKVYLKKTTATTITADTWDNMISGATLVYDGTIQFNPSGWFTINFSSSFNYDADNLLVLTEANYGDNGNGSYPKFYYTAATSMNASQSQDETPPTGNLLVGNSRPNLKVSVSVANMAYVSSTTTQTVSVVNAGATHQQVIGIQVVVTGTQNPLTLTKLVVNANGTTSVSDISNAKIWYTGLSSTFATTSQFGSTVASPTLANFDIDGTQELVEGTNYFWLTYDIASGATENHVVDAECSSVTVGGSAHTPSVQAPVGSRTIKIALNGTYTVGTGGNYTSFTKVDGLFAAINEKGLSGNVTINVISDITDETGATDLNQWTEIGAGNYTLTIQPNEATLRTISGTYAGGLIRLNGADRVTINGNFSGNGQYLLFSNSIEGTSNNTFALSNTAADNTIKNCKVYSKFRAITTTVASNTLIEGNDIYGDVAGNSYYYQAGVSVGTTSTNTRIIRNTIHDFYYTGTTGYGCFGVVYDSDATTVTEISNNVIYAIKGDGDANDISSAPQGIYIASGGNCKIYYNSIYLSGNTLGRNYNGLSTCIGVSSDITALDIRNNILQNSMGEYPGSTRTNVTYLVYSASANTAFTDIDYNNYYFTDEPDVTEYVGYLGSARADLAAWRTATGKDTHSKSYNPNFTSTTNLDLMISNNMGTPIAGFATDYSGATRDVTNPDMGAYENATHAVTFNGAANAWEVATNWTPNAVPNSSTNVTIPADKLAVVNSNDYECNNLTIEPLGQLTINSGKDLLSNGAFLIQSDATGTGSFIENGTFEASSNTIQRYLTNYSQQTDKKYHFISSPVSAQAIQPNWVANSPAANVDFYKFDEVTNYWINTKTEGGVWNAAFENNFVVGRGYLIAYPTEATKSFAGDLNSYTAGSPLVLTCTHTADKGDGWNLLGNPFPSAIDWDAVAKGDGMDNALYYYDATAENYRYYIQLDGESGSLGSGQRYIPAMQGFMVHAKSTGTKTVAIDNGDRVHQGQNVFYKTAATIPGSLSLKVSAGGYEDVAFVHFNNGATAQFDGDYDAYKLYSYNEGVPQIYTLSSDDKKLAINGLPDLSNTTEVLVWFEPGTTGSQVLTADVSQLPANAYLHDLKTGVFTDLRQNPVYTFSASTTDAPNRFKLTFGSVGIDTPMPSPVSIYTYANRLHIRNAGNATVELINMAGQVVERFEVNEAGTFSRQLTLSAGAYVVRVMSGNTVSTQKIVIN